MLVKDTTKQDIRECFNNLRKYLDSKEIKWTSYIQLGSKIVKIISYSEDFVPLIEKQLTYILKPNAQQYDSTIVVWQESEISSVAKTLSPKLNPRNNLRLRLQVMGSKENHIDAYFIDESFSKTKPVVDIQSTRGFIIANDHERNVYYYGVRDLEPEEFIKEGHIFVQIFNHIIKAPTANLAHGAVIGLDGKGILICARGQRGKSTLSVLSMIQGFEYVSDDYLILEKAEKDLYSYPIYSIITLSSKMYNQLYSKLEGSRFLSNNARKDKYVFNISNFHDRFRNKYPIKFCIFPEIVSDLEPSIEPCPKGRAIVQLIQSTLMQTGDLAENWTVKKLYNMIKDFEFYKFNLCSDIEKNTEFLRYFMQNFDGTENKPTLESKVFEDITFDYANFLDSQSGNIYAMNKFTTNIYQNLKEGVSLQKILSRLEEKSKLDEKLKFQLDNLIKILIEKDILLYDENLDREPFIEWDFMIEDNRQLSFIEYKNGLQNELIRDKEIKNELCIK